MPVAGDSSDFDDLIFRFLGHEFTLSPRDHQVKWKVDDKNELRTAFLVDFNRWTITEATPQRWKISLDNGATIEVYAWRHGLYRMKGLGKRLIFEQAVTPTVGKAEEVVELASDDWWIVSTKDWTMDATDRLQDADDSSIFVFFDDTDTQDVRGYLVNLSDDDLLVHSKNSEKIAAVFRFGWWEMWERAIASVREEINPATAETKALDEWAKIVNVSRRSGEAQEAYRARVKGVFVARFAANDPDSIINAITSMIGGTEGDVVLTENDVGHAQFSLKVDLGRLEDLGITDLSATLDDIKAVAKSMAPAGVRVVVTATGGASYDAGDVYDGGDLYAT